ncbi:NACHT domain-containing protein [Streptomyces sp. NPDC051018]|uniref:NACHT domain-containing protein n=1 Tax=Streptomyces sp. NPDC051018 TaxID=3365639 RepID=UPI0037A95DDD
MRNSASMRVVAVHGQRQGTGVLISPRYVLTCAHVLHERGRTAEISHLALSYRVPCEVVWSGAAQGVDAALLHTGAEVIPAARLGRLRWGRPTRDDPLPGCQTMGFPGQQRYGGTELDFGQYTGSVLPVAGRVRGALTFWLDHSPGAVPPGGTSPLDGLSGSPVFAGSVLMGIVSAVRGTEGHQQLEAVPLRAVHEPLVSAFRNHGPHSEAVLGLPPLENLAGFDPRDAAFEERYAAALTVRYRRTEIFGIDDLGISEASWDLDTAYLSLEATRLPGEGVRTGSTRTEGTWPPGENIRAGSIGTGSIRAEHIQAASIRDESIRAEHIQAASIRDESNRTEDTRTALPPPANPGTADPGPAHGPHRVEDLLGTSRRVLLRGEAGAGKTTLVWWLASHAANGTLPAELDELNGLVPFVVPMRSLQTQGDRFPAPDELAGVAELPVGRPPEGWAERVLESGRALLLVDGLDELPEVHRHRADRHKARAWLTGLLRRYGDCRALATVRPGAVEPGWLAAEGFADLLLLPMSDGDIAAFLTAWHRAARLEYAALADTARAEAESRHLDSLEKALRREFRRNRVLSDLARTPLLCAVICVLHRKREGELPRTRWELYHAALEMLLGKRDRRRGIDAPEGLAIGIEEHKLLLQHLAVWLVRNGRTQLTPDEAVTQIAKAARGMPQVLRQGTAERILTHLLNRSGLLQQRTGEAIQFIHRTFQDYLAAKEFAETDSLSELLHRASDEQWQDVIRLSVGHFDRGRVSRLIDRLGALGDAAQDGRSLHLLAGHCAASAVFLDGRVREETERRIVALMPPGQQHESFELAALGDYVLPLLPGPSDSVHTDARVINTIVHIGGAPAMEALAPFTGHADPQVRLLLVAAWSGFPVERYARDVLSRVRLDDVLLRIDTDEQLRQLCHVGGVRSLSIRGNHGAARLDAVLPAEGLDRLLITRNREVTDLRFVRSRPTVSRLTLADCPGLTTLDELCDRSFSQLGLDTRLLALPAPRTRAGRLSLTGRTAFPYDGLARWTAVEQLALDRADLLHIPSLVEAVARMTACGRLELRHLEEFSPDVPVAVPGISELALAGIGRPIDTELLAQVFPGLRRLELGFTGYGIDPPCAVDLTPWLAHADLTVHLTHRRDSPPQVRGAESFAGRLCLEPVHGLRLGPVH